MNTPPTAGTQARTDVYLREIAKHLHGPRRRRAQILAELSDGLDQAIADQNAAGLPIKDATSAAITRFGAPMAVADAFAAELTIAYARQVLAWFVVTGPLVGIWWLLLLHPAPWHGSMIALVAAIPVVPLIAAGIAAAATTFATTGRLIRWLPEAGARRAAAAALGVAGLTIAGDVTIVGVYLGSDPLATPLGIVAVVASLTRIGVSLVTVRCAAGFRRRAAVPARSPVARDARP
jgi:hypothetical protein